MQASTTVEEKSSTVGLVVICVGASVGLGMIIAGGLIVQNNSAGNGSSANGQTMGAAGDQSSGWVIMMWIGAVILMLSLALGLFIGIFRAFRERERRVRVGKDGKTVVEPRKVSHVKFWITAIILATLLAGLIVLTIYSAVKATDSKLEQDVRNFWHVFSMVSLVAILVVFFLGMLWLVELHRDK